MINLFTGRPEPVMDAATIAALASAVLAAAVAFGVPLSAGQKTALIALIAIVAPFIAQWFIARPQVTPLSNPQDDQGYPLGRVD